MDKKRECPHCGGEMRIEHMVLVDPLVIDAEPWYDDSGWICIQCAAISLKEESIKKDAYPV